MAVTPKDYRSGEKIKFIKYLHQRKLISETQYSVNQDIVDDITLISTQTSIKESLLSIYYQEWNESDYEVLKEDISDDVLGYVLCYFMYPIYVYVNMIHHLMGIYVCIKISYIILLRIIS